MATKGKAGRRKKKVAPYKKDAISFKEEEEESLLCIDEPDDAQIKEAEDIIERFERKYKHKIEDVKAQEQSAFDEFFTTISPSKRKESEEDEDNIIQCTTVNSSTLNSSQINNDKENIVAFLSNAKTEREEYAIKGKPLDERRSLSRQPSLEPSSLTTPENQYNLFVHEKQPKKRFSHFRYSKLDSSNSLPPSPATVNSLAFPSPSQSPQDEPVVINKKAVKALSFDYVHQTTNHHQGPVDGGAGAKKGKKTRSSRRLKKESQQGDIDEWAESIQKEFQEVDQFQLVID